MIFVSYGYTLFDVYVIYETIGADVAARVGVRAGDAAGEFVVSSCGVDARASSIAARHAWRARRARYFSANSIAAYLR